MKFTLTLVIILFSSSSFSAEVIGRITKLRGEITRSNTKNNIEDEKVKQGSNIYVGDSLSSESGSFAKVLMNDDTIFSIGPKTEFVFENFKMKNKKSKDRSATYYLAKGKLRSLFTRKAPRRTLKIRTPAASMAVRGTEIVSDVYKLDGKFKVDIGLLSGKLEVHSQGKIINLRPKEIFEIQRGPKAGRMPANDFKMRKMDAQVFNSLRKATSKGGQNFLFDALKAKRKMASEKADFSFNTGLKKEKKKFKRVKIGEKSLVNNLKQKTGNGRSPASNKAGMRGQIPSDKINEKVKKAHHIKNKDVLREAGKDFGSPKMGHNTKSNHSSKVHMKDKINQNKNINLEKVRNLHKESRLIRKPTETRPQCPAGTIMIGGICQKQPIIKDPLLSDPTHEGLIKP